MKVDPLNLEHSHDSPEFPNQNLRQNTEKTLKNYPKIRGLKILENPKKDQKSRKRYIGVAQRIGL